MWIDEAFEELEVVKQEATVVYSARFKGYNANVRYQHDCYEFRLSKQFREVDDEIKKGVVQQLLRKIHPKKPKTLAIKLYEEFLKRVADYAPRKQSPQELINLFNELNEEYFGGLMIQPNLEWGSYSLTKLGHYHYGTDTVRLSTVLREDQDLLAYVLYHELLHKKHKFIAAKNHTKHHTKAFREEEQQFKLPNAEQQLEEFIKSKRTPKKLRSKLKTFFS
jgi:predicted metal-dependent hydrolase